VLLRIAIGWHFQYEGWWKIDSWRKGDKPFSAEGYLRNASGPLAPYFRQIVPDVDGRAKLDPGTLKAGWQSDVLRVADHYGFNEDQRSKAQAALRDAEQFADDWFVSRESRESVQKYLHDLDEVEKVERNPLALESQREWAAAQRRTLDADRKKVTAELDARAASLREAVAKLAAAEQAASAGSYKPPLTTLDYNNYLTAFGLVAMGGCLMLGLFTRFAALAGATFLALIYLSNPPWPGLPASPTAEGHVWIVDKNLIEMLACLALTFLPTGHWVGFDALLFGRRRRARLLREELAAAEREPARGPGRFAHRVS
jgi:uncharacterized membrane protein YphA (DoxX/SURF4 family)